MIRLERDSDGYLDHSNRNMGGPGRSYRPSLASVGDAATPEGPAVGTGGDLRRGGHKSESDCPNPLPEALRASCTRLGLSRHDLADMMNVKPQTVDAWLSGYCRPGVAKLADLRAKGLVP